MTISNRYTYWVKTATGSDTPVQLYPNWGYKERGNVNKIFSRTQGGQLNAYSLVSSWQEFTLPLQVNSAIASNITSWWKTDTLVHFTLNSSVGAAEFPGFFTLDDAVFGLLDQSYNPLIDFAETKDIPCRIASKTEPFPMNMKGQFNKFQGILTLTTV